MPQNRPPEILYHVSRAPDRLEHLAPFTHLGTLHAARCRGVARVMIGHPRRCYAVALDVQTPLRVQDLEYGSHSWKRLVDQLHYTLGVVTGEERTRVFEARHDAEAAIRALIAGEETHPGSGQPLRSETGRAPHGTWGGATAGTQGAGLTRGKTRSPEGVRAAGGEAAFREIRAVLSRHGVDALVYRNNHEDAGQDSWVVLDPGSARLGAVAEWGTMTAAEHDDLVFGRVPLAAFLEATCPAPLAGGIPYARPMERESGRRRHGPKPG